MQQRYYDPVFGRFLSVDPIGANAISGDNFTRFGYAGQNPYRFTDPDGRLACLPGSRHGPFGGSTDDPCITPPQNPWGGGNPTPSWEEGPSHSHQSPESTPAFFDGEYVTEATDEEYLARFPGLAKQREAIVRANIRMAIRAVIGVSLEDVAIRGGSIVAIRAGNRIQGKIDALDARARRRGGMYTSERSARRILKSSQKSASHLAQGFRYAGYIGLVYGVFDTVISEYEGIVTEELERGD